MEAHGQKSYFFDHASKNEGINLMKHFLAPAVCSLFIPLLIPQQAHSDILHIEKVKCVKPADRKATREVENLLSNLAGLSDLAKNKQLATFRNNYGELAPAHPTKEFIMKYTEGNSLKKAKKLLNGKWNGFDHIFFTVDGRKIHHGARCNGGQEKAVGRHIVFTGSAVLELLQPDSGILGRIQVRGGDNYRLPEQIVLSPANSEKSVYLVTYSVERNMTKPAPIGAGAYTGHSCIEAGENRDVTTSKCLKHGERRAHQLWSLDGWTQNANSKKAVSGKIRLKGNSNTCLGLDKSKMPGTKFFSMSQKDCSKVSAWTYVPSTRALSKIVGGKKMCAVSVSDPKRRSDHRGWGSVFMGACNGSKEQHWYW